MVGAPTSPLEHSEIRVQQHLVFVIMLLCVVTVVYDIVDFGRGELFRCTTIDARLFIVQPVLCSLGRVLPCVREGCL